MFEKEEEKLNELRKHLEHVELPQGEIDGAILQGMERAIREKQVRRTKRKKGLWTLAVSAVLLFTLITSIRVSPTFANAVSTIPGMEKIVAMIHYDKGLTAAIENDYYQVIDVSQTRENVTLTIDGVILDESGMNVFYTVKSDEFLQNPEVRKVEINNSEIRPGSISYGFSPSDQAVKEFSNRIDFHFHDPTKFTDLGFSLLMKVKNAGKEIEFNIPFTVPKNVKPSVTYTLNKEVEIENQKFTIEEVMIHPLRVGIKISIEPQNTMEILQFEDLRLEDEQGEIWGSIANVASGREVSETEQIFYLQSNYFEKPKELYVRINKLQAINKDEAVVILDTEKNQLVKSPKDGKLKLGDSNKSQADLFMNEITDDAYGFNLASSVKDANGKLIGTPSVSMRYDSGQKERHLVIEFETTNYLNPLYLEIDAYPNYIEGDVKVELKKPNK